jgi:hypothetical protein
MTGVARARFGVFILAAGLAVSFVICLGPITNPDLPWHLAAGRQIAATGSVPHTDFLSWTMAGRPWVDFEWAAQLIYHGLDRVGGTAALWAFKCAQFFTLALMFAALLRLWSFPASWIGVATPVFIAALFPFLDIRPEAFSMIFFMLQLYVLEKRRLGLLRADARVVLAAHLVLYAVWANLHSGFPVGLALCVCYGAGGLAAAGLAGTCLNPYGLRLYAVFWEHGKDLAALRRLVIEWSPPNFRNEYQYGYWAVILFSYAGFLMAAPRGAALPAEHIAAIVVFSLFASRAFRTTAYAMLLLYPLALHAWRRFTSPSWWHILRPWVLLAVLAVGSWMISRFFREQNYLRTFSAPRVAPERVCAFLRAEKTVLSGLPMFNTYNWGGYLDYALYPDYRVFMDGRYLFADLLRRMASAENNPGRWRKIMDEMGVDLALLENNGHIIRAGRDIYWRAFDAYAMPRAEWALVYWDSEGMILVRRSKVPSDWLKRHEFRFLRPRDLRHLGLRIVADEVRESDVTAEIDRYMREIGDPRESFRLTSWYREFKKGLTAAQPQPQDRKPALR